MSGKTTLYNIRNASWGSPRGLPLWMGVFGLGLTAVLVWKWGWRAA